MTVQFECEVEVDWGIDCAGLAREVAEKVLEMENCPYDASVNLVLTDNEEIKRVNTEFRNILAPTDVLSFPMIPFETPADYSVVEEDDSYFDLDTDELLLGDIMISAEKAAAQAQAEKIKTLSVTIKTKAGDGGRIFGSITSKDIADALKAQHKLTVDKKKIQLDSPIKQTGEMEVAMKLYPEVTTTLKVIIVAE